MSDSVGKKVDPKAQQREMMKDQPVNRPQTKTNKSQDAKDIGSRGDGPKGNMEGQSATG